MKTRWIDKKKHKLLIVFFIFIFLCAFGLWLRGGLPISINGCPIYHATGKYGCPGYGGTRAMRALTRFDLIGAMQFNLLFVILGFYASLCAINCLYQIIRYNRFISVKASHAYVILAAALIFTIIRNMPFWTWH